MGEEKEKTEKKEGGGKDSPAPIVLTMDLHCNGCCIKVKNAIKRMSGVESVATDLPSGKVTVTGSADAVKLKEKLEDKMHKPVTVVSAPKPPKKDADAKEGGGDKKADNGKQQKPAEEKKPKEPVESTVVMKIRLHCEGCMDRIKRRIFKVKGVKEVTFDAAKDLVTVKGTMDVPAMHGYLREKLNRGVDIMAPGKKDDGVKKDDGKKEKGGDEEKKKEKEKAEKAPEQAMVTETTAMPMMPMMVDPGRYDYHYANYYAPYGYRMEMAHAPQMFSDENPNASCSIM